MNKATTFPADDHRTYNRDGQAFNVGETFAGLPYSKAIELTDELKAFVPAGMPMATWALRWILDFDAVTVIIPGAKNPAQAQVNASASALPPLPAEQHGKLREFYRDHVQQHIRGPY